VYQKRPTLRPPSNVSRKDKYVKGKSFSIGEGTIQVWHPCVREEGEFEARGGKSVEMEEKTHQRHWGAVKAGHASHKLRLDKTGATRRR
jgi:hypothetical protein